MGGLDDLIKGLLVVMPPWAVALLVGLIALAALPGLRFSLRTKRVRALVRQLVRAEPLRRRQLEEALFATAGTHPDLLATAARDARRRNLLAVHAEAMRRLAQTPRGHRLAAAVRAEFTADDAPPADPLLRLASVRAALDAGTPEVARARLVEARAAFPNDPRLAALDEALRAAETAAAEAAPTASDAVSAR